MPPDVVLDHPVIAFEPGAASRVGNHVYDDGVTGALRANAGDNQQAIAQMLSKECAVGTDIYNGELTGDIAASLTASSGQSSTHSGPSVMQPMNVDVRNGELQEKASTLQAKVGRSLNDGGVILERQNEPTYCIQGNCIDRADTAGCNGKGWTEDVCYTLNTIDRPAVVQGVPLLNDQGGQSISADDNAAVSPTIRAEMHGNVPAVAQRVMALENHPNDSRVKISEDNVVQTLSGRMGTGGAILQ